jgi:hypothetical protein
MKVRLVCENEKIEEKTVRKEREDLPYRNKRKIGPRKKWREGEG